MSMSMTKTRNRLRRMTMAKSKERELLIQCFEFVAEEYYGMMGDSEQVKSLFDALYNYFGEKKASRLLKDFGHHEN